MSINQIIKQAVEPVVPICVPVLYDGNEEVYTTFDVNTIGADFGDDAPAHEINLVQVHLFAPFGVNTIDIRRKIKRALFDAGMTWPVEEDATDEDGQHFVFECELATAVEVD